MTLTDEERERVRQVLDRYAAEAPPAPTWGAWETVVRRPRPTGPLVALAAAASVILIIGLPVLVRWVGPDSAPVDPIGAETWRDWYDRVVSESELNGRDPTIVQGKLGPDPQFDLGSLGVEQSLTPVSQVLGGPPWNLLFDGLVTERETLVVAGSTSDSAIAAVTAGVLEGEGRAGIPGICVVVAVRGPAGEWTKGGSCREESDAVDYDEGPLYVSLGVGSSLDGQWVAVAVSPQTSVVGVVAGDVRYWQRPRGGLVLFAVDFIESGRLTSYSTSGEILAQWPTSPEPTVGPSTTSTSTPSVTVGEATGIEPLRLDDLVSLVPVEMEDGTRFAVLLATSLVPGRVEVTSGLSNAEIRGPGFEGSLAYELCPGATQDAGTLNHRGALVALVLDQLVVCRPDQLLTLDIRTTSEFPAGALDSFDIVPVDIGHSYMAAVDGSDVSSFCCDVFGPIRLGSLVVTANRTTSGEITAWDYDTLLPRWTTIIGDASSLLGSYGELVIATPGGGSLIGIETATGDTIWELQLPAGEEVVGTTDDSGVGTWYLATEYSTEGEVASPRLRAVNVQSGELVWVEDLRPETVLQWVDPVLFPDKVVVMDVPRFVNEGTTTSSHLIALDRTTGEQIWEVDLEDPTERFSDRLLAHDPERGILIAATPAGQVFSIDPETGQIRWRTTTGFVRIMGLDDEAVVLQRGSGLLELDLQSGAAIER